MTKSVKRWNKSTEPDDILAADYSYSILLTECIREITPKNFHWNVTAAIHDAVDIQCYINMRADLIKNFDQGLDEHARSLENGQSQKGRKIFPCINKDVFQKVREYHQVQARETLEKQLNALDAVENFGKLDLDAAKFQVSLFFWIIHFEMDERITSRVENWRKKRPEIFRLDASMINAAKNKLYEENETLQIVEDVIVPRDAESLRGKMKIVRVTSNDKGHRFYQTLCIARNVASKNNHYMFEVIRDFGNFRLNELSVRNSDNSVYRVRRVLQTNECHYKAPNTLEPCRWRCKNYAPRYPELICKNCGHIHKQIKLYKDLKHLPVLLILQRRGRLGDTFPVSFNCMDLRICYRDRVSTNYIQSVILLYCPY